MCDLYLVQTFGIISASDERFIPTLGWLLTLILTGIMLLVSRYKNSYLVFMSCHCTRYLWRIS